MAYDPFKTNFGIGARVKVIRQRKYPSEKLLDLIGTVRTDYSNQVSVVFDTITNTRSAYGAFYFKPVDLVEVDEFDNEIKEEKNMSRMSKITNYLNTAMVELSDNRGKNGTFKFANFEADLQEDDICVVMTEFEVLRVGRVVEIIPHDELTEHFREVVAKVYTDAYDTRVELRAKAAELKAKMEARAKQLQDIALYQMLAKDDPDMADLLNEYQGLPKV